MSVKFQENAWVDETWIAMGSISLEALTSS